MHFGKKINQYILLGIAILALYSCDSKKEKSIYFISPVEGAKVISGARISLKTDANPGDFDSIKYLIDTKVIASRKDTQSVNFPTSGLPFGGRLITAIIYNGKDSAEVTTNIQLLPANSPKQLSYKIVNVFPHDTTSYTEGLEFHEGTLYESDGGYADLGGSSLRQTDLKTGKILKKVDIDTRYFAEGITIIGDKIIQLTYKEGVGFEYDKNTFKMLREFPYSAGREGWGLCFDGARIYNTDGSNTIYILNKDTYQKEGSIEVYDNSGPVVNLNELELVDGKIYANIYTTDKIAVIDPHNGGVEAYIDLTGILPVDDYVKGITDVLNGIAWDSKGRRLFVTGKKWNKLFEIKVK